MKKIYTIVLLGIIAASLFSQVPQKMSYQAVVRDGSGVLIASQVVGMEICIVQGAVDGPSVYSETHSPTTNLNGLVSVEIGAGTTSDDFSSIDWGADTYFVKTETDPSGGTDYTISGTSQLLSVPYAMYADISGSSGDLPDGLSAGDLLYYDGTSLQSISSGEEGQVLSIQGGVPSWIFKNNAPEGINVVKILAADEDYINFGTFENFTNNSDWAIVEKVKMPAGTGTNGGWHFFRGYAWADQEGDIAISLSNAGVHAWCQKSGWQSIQVNQVFEEEKWYNICFQYDATNLLLELFVNGAKVGELENVAALDDTGNTNQLFWGGQEVNESRNEGDLYSEASVIIAHQAWYQRLLTPVEISEYDGSVSLEATLFFSSEIGESSVADASGNGNDGINGNSPEFIEQAP
jgi:hypothetical protein